MLSSTPRVHPGEILAPVPSHRKLLLFQSLSVPRYSILASRSLEAPVHLFENSLPGGGDPTGSALGEPMSDAPQNNSSAKWTSTQVLIQAAICLVIGFALGHLLRGSQGAASVKAAKAQTTDSSTAGVAQVTPEQLKHMADKQAEPLLAQLQSKPNDPELLAKLGLTYYASHNFMEASEYYKRSVAVKDDAAVRIELGRAYYYAGASDRALAEFERAAKMDPKNANALYNIGMIKWQRNFDPDGAVLAWRQMLKSNPNHPRRAEVEQLIARAKRHRDVKQHGNTRE